MGITRERESKKLLYPSLFALLYFSRKRKKMPKEGIELTAAVWVYE
jgi:hypothetical protein